MFKQDKDALPHPNDRRIDRLPRSLPAIKKDKDTDEKKGQELVHIWAVRLLEEVFPLGEVTWA